MLKEIGGFIKFSFLSLITLSLISFMSYLFLMILYSSITVIFDVEGTDILLKSYNQNSLGILGHLTAALELVRIVVIGHFYVLFGSISWVLAYRRCSNSIRKKTLLNLVIYMSIFFLLLYITSIYKVVGLIPIVSIIFGILFESYIMAIWTEKYWCKNIGN